MKYYKTVSLIFLFSVIGNFSFASQDVFVEKVKKLAALEVNQLSAFRTWNYVIKNYVYNEEKYFSKDIEISSAEAYYNLPLAKRAVLKSENKKIASLEKLISESTIVNYAKEIKKLRKEIKILQEKNSNVDFLKEQVRKFQNHELVIEPPALDYFLGIDYDEVEPTIPITKDQSPDLAIGHSKFFTQVHYATLREVFKLLKVNKGDVFYDISSSYGRSIIYGSILYPEGKFKGIEPVQQRVDEAKSVGDKLKLDNVNFFVADILKYDFSEGNIFFIFNPFPSLMPQVLTELNRISKKKKIKIIALSGTSSELNLIPWLKLIYTVPRTHYTRTPGAIYESL